MLGLRIACTLQRMVGQFILIILLMNILLIVGMKTRGQMKDKELEDHELQNIEFLENKEAEEYMKELYSKNKS